ncbi:MAG: PKD domain-containing protein, partial [Methanospirillum sp.]|uniref:PKD domain-containing protein n=1 Tax=Methanospirillum sp. TaxID=45200 RepID=UPI00236DE1AF
VQVDNSTYLVSGYTNSNDGDVTGNHGSYDVWVASLGTQNTEENFPSIDMETLLSPTGAKTGTSTLGSLSKWTFTTIDADQTNTTGQTVASSQIKASFIVNSTQGPAPLTVACTSTSLGNPTSFSWDFGDGTTSGLKNPLHTYTTPGTYSITLRAMDAKTGGVGVMIDAITVTENRQFATKYSAPGTV